MNSKRILAIASLIEKKDYILDIGCDHAYLDIYLIKNDLCRGAIASDISHGAIDQAKKNIVKYNLNHKIDVLLADGLMNVDVTLINTLVLSGMGTSTILRILDNPKRNKIKKIIIQSNNNLDNLRCGMQKLGYKIDQELVVLEHGKYYTIISYSKGHEKLNFAKKNIGVLSPNNLDYYNYLIDTNKKILLKLPGYYFFKRLKLNRINRILNNYLETI